MLVGSICLVITVVVVLMRRKYAKEMVKSGSDILGGGYRYMYLSKLDYYRFEDDSKKSMTENLTDAYYL